MKIDPKYFRPTEVDVLRADPSKLKREIGWESKVTFSQLARIMVDADMKEIGLKPKGEGESALSSLYSKRWWKKD